MAFIDNFLIPLIKTTFLIGIGSVLLFFIVRFCYRFYFQKLKWIIKYKLLKKPLRQGDTDWMLKAFSHKMNLSQVKMKLLLQDLSQERVYEVLYLYNQMIMKGGHK